MKKAELIARNEELEAKMKELKHLLITLRALNQLKEDKSREISYEINTALVKYFE